MKKYIGILAKITGFILIVILAVNIILPLIKRNPDAAYEKELEQTTFTEETMKDVGTSAYEFYICDFISVKFYMDQSRTDS